MFSLKMKGLDSIKKLLSDAPRGTKGAAVEAAAKYLIGDGKRGLKHYPAYKWITRKSAYGQTFVSDKQRRYVMMQIKAGKIDPGAPHRTGNYQRSWEMRGSGTQTRIVGELPHSSWPDRLAKKVGWRAIEEIVKTNTKGALQAANRVVAEWIRKHSK